MRLSMIVGLALSVLGSACANNDSPLQIFQVTGPQLDATKDVCDSQLPGLLRASFSFSVYAALNSATTPTQLDYFKSNLSRTLWIRSNTADVPIGFNDTDVNGSGRVDFQANEVIYNYVSDSISLAAETLTIWGIIPAGADPATSCFGGVPLLAQGALTTVFGTAVTSDIEIIVHLRLRGRFTNGQLAQTNEIAYPLTLSP